MEIGTFTQQIEQQVKELSLSNSNDVIELGKSLSVIRSLLMELQEFVHSYQFKDVSEEIQFFKVSKPVLLAQYIYTKKKFQLLLFASFRDRKSRLENNQRVLEKLQRYARKHQSFYEYCMSGNSYLDVHYFTRMQGQIADGSKDMRFTTLHDGTLSKILAHDLIKSFVAEDSQNIHGEASESSRGSLTWTSSKVKVVELIYALHAAGTFNNGAASIKDIAEFFEFTFGVELGNYAKVFTEIKMRKKGKSIFLDQMRLRLLEIMETDDDA